MPKPIDKPSVAEKQKHRDWLKAHGVNHNKAKALVRETYNATAREIADNLREWARELTK